MSNSDDVRHIVEELRRMLKKPHPRILPPLKQGDIYEVLVNLVDAVEKLNEREAT